MEPERKPDIVDLARYKKAVEDQAKRKSADPKPPGREPLLGSRPRAGLILVVALLVLIGFWVMSRF